MKLWIDDVRPAPEGYEWCKSVDEAKDTITYVNSKLVESWRNGNLDPSLFIELIDLDHDAGDYAKFGGDYIKLLDWLEWLYQGEGTYTEFRIHSMNPVGVANMRAIIEKNGWKEIRQ